MNRDPFNIRRSPLPAFQLLRNSADTIQRTANQASQRIVSAIGDTTNDIGLRKKVDDELETESDTGGGEVALLQCRTHFHKMALHNGIPTSGQEQGRMDTPKGVSARK
jgi:hypothetical protein